MNANPNIKVRAANGICADASKVSPREFIDALGLSSLEIRERRRQQTIAGCIAAIERGDTYGWPPLLVAECRAIMAHESAMKSQERY